jgi:hypothetical protein
MSLVRKQERGRREAGRAQGRSGRAQGKSCRALWDAGRTWALALREMGAIEGCGQGREGLTWCSLAHSGHSRKQPGMLAGDLRSG